MSSEGLRLRIPRERVGVLIGPEGEIKSAIENKLSVEMSVDGDTGNVGIVSSAGGNPADMFKARDVVTAIGRGFSPENAFNLFDEDAVLIIIDLREYFGRSDSDIGRVKGRIIGEKGKARRNLEEISGTKISLYGHTIAIIGDVVHTDIAKEAVEMFIEGKSHSTVYRSLQAKRDELRKQEAEIWRGPEKE
jgi:ribosomal RNA assembly protein